jgi:PAS domain-containing protein
MSSNVRFCTTDADHEAMAAFVGGIQSDDAALAAAQAARVRRLADVTRYVVERTRTDAPRTQDMAMRSAAAELACAMRLSDRTVLTQMGDAIAMVDGFPATFAAWEAGRINRAHAVAVVEFGTPLPHEARAAFEAEAIAVCERETPGRARPLLQLAAERMHPRTLEQRHHAARDTRRVRVVPLADGMADVVVTTTITLAHAIMDRLTRQATLVKDARVRAAAGMRGAAGADAGAVTGAGAAAEGARTGDGGADAGASPQGSGGDGRPQPTAREIVATDERSFDQIRADLVADMLLTAAPGADPTAADGPGELGAVRALVQVVVPVLTLLGRSDEPAELVGRSPIDPATARTLAGGVKGFDRILTHPVTGAVLHVDRYRSSTALQRFLRGRDIRCRFPGCRMPAIWCDKDHTKDAAGGGPTRDDNLSHVCERHHLMKHATPWQVRQLAGGVMEWTSPLGHVYTDLPPGAGLPGSTAGSLRPAGRSASDGESMESGDGDQGGGRRRVRFRLDDPAPF